MKFVVEVILFAVAAVSSSKIENPLVVFVRHHDKPIVLLRESRKTQLDQSSINAYFRAGSVRVLRSCLRNCDALKAKKKGFECKIKCEEVADKVKDVKDKSNGNGNGNGKGNGKGNGNGDGDKKTENTGYSYKCKGNSTSCIYVTLINSDEETSVIGDILEIQKDR